MYGFCQWLISVVWVLLSLYILFALIFVSLGVIQNLSPYIFITLLGGVLRNLLSVCRGDHGTSSSALIIYRTGTEASHVGPVSEEVKTLYPFTINFPGTCKSLQNLYMSIADPDDNFIWRRGIMIGFYNVLYLNVK